MASVSDHSHAGSIALGGMAVWAVYQPDSRLEDAYWGLLFLWGNILPDISNFFYRYIAWYRGRNLDLLDSKHWPKYFFRAVDRAYPRLHPYKWLHSLLLYTPWFLIGSEYTDAVLYGCILHCLIDAVTHEDCWLLWPLFTVRISFNWWECWPFNSWYWQQVPYLSIPLIICWQGYYLT